MKRINIVLTDDLKQRIDKISKSKGLSMSAFLRMAVIELLERFENE